MIELTIKVEHINYEDLADLLLPMLMEQVPKEGLAGYLLRSPDKTEALVKELLSRSDCPVEFMTPTNSDKVWREEYLVGRFEYNYVDENNTVEHFNAFNAYDELERAVLYARANPNLTILKKVYIKQDFD